MRNQYKLLKKEGYVKVSEVIGIGKNNFGNTALIWEGSMSIHPGTYGVVIDKEVPKVGESMNLRKRSYSYRAKVKDPRQQDEEHNKLMTEMFKAFREGKKVELFEKRRGTRYFDEELQQWEFEVGPLKKYEKKDKKLFECRYK